MKESNRETGVYHPSSMGGCKRKLYYERTAAPREQWGGLQDLLYRLLGHIVHDGLQDFFKKLRKTFKAEVKIRVPDLHIAGSVDGVFPLLDWVIEIKTIGDASFKKLTKPLHDHLVQVHAYMWALDIPRAQILYVNRANTDRWGENTRTFKVPFDFDLFEAFVLRPIADVEAHIEAGTIPEQEISSYKCSRCAFLKHCDPDLSK
jgi:CRISPR/Cas system-associated exonuclease Cas4 (RecB family)